MSKVIRKIAFLTQFGLTILIPTCLLFFLGYKLDKHLGTSHWCIVFFFVGAVAGFWRIKQRSQRYSQSRQSSHERDGK